MTQPNYNEALAALDKLDAMTVRGLSAPSNVAVINKRRLAETLESRLLDVRGNLFVYESSLTAKTRTEAIHAAAAWCRGQK